PHLRAAAATHLAPEAGLRAVARLRIRPLDAAFDPRLEPTLYEPHAQQWPEQAQAADTGNRLGRGRGVDLDVGNAGTDEGGVDIAPRNRHRHAIGTVAGERARLPRQRHALQLALIAYAAAMAQAFHAGFRGAGTEAATALEAEHQRRRPWAIAMQLRGEAIAGHDVEADARRDHDARLLRARMLSVAVGEDVDLAGDVEIMSARGQAAFQHRCAGRGKRAGAMQHQIDAAQAFHHGTGEVEGELAPAQSQLVGQRAHGGFVAAGEDRLQAAPGGFGGDQAAGVAVGTVDQPLHGALLPWPQWERQRAATLEAPSYPFTGTASHALARFPCRHHIRHERTRPNQAAQYSGADQVTLEAIAGDTPHCAGCLRSPLRRGMPPNT